MSVITAIKQQQKRADRCSVFIDGKYTFSLSLAQLEEEGIAVRDELDSRQLAALVQKSGFGKALDRVYQYLAIRPRSRYEITSYCNRKGYDEGMTAQIVDRLDQHDLLNDERFAADWVGDRREAGHRSRTKLRHELMQKRIAREIIDSVLEDILEDDEVGLVVDMIERRRLRFRYADEQKLIGYLMGRGFRYGTIKAALERLLSD